MISRSDPGTLTPDTANPDLANPDRTNLDTAPADAAVPEHPSAASARRLATFGLTLVAVTLLAIGALHLLPQTSGISPVRRTISEYALSPLGWVFEVAVLLLAAGSAAILLALVRCGLVKPVSTGSALLALWSVSLVMLVIFTKHNWAVGPSTEGQVHRVFSLVAFLSLPIGVLSIARRRRDRAHPVADRVSAWWATGLGWLSLAWFSPLALAVLLAPITGTPWYRAIPLGLVERGLALTEVLAVACLGIWALRHQISESPEERIDPAPR
ncbi:DUF998 domain-containing protein [Nakamurella silvestris]|nr:DUF998 domain-containing protein [Nakamurella silvestris]